MTPYQVEWLPEALDALTDAWLSAVDRFAITQTEQTIDRTLARDPVGQGTWLHEGLYQLTSKPLTVFYSVDEEKHLVEVIEVWFIP